MRTSTAHAIQTLPSRPPRGTRVPSLRTPTALTIAMLALLVAATPARAGHGGSLAGFGCVEYLSDGSYLAVFGYRNDGPPVEIAVDPSGNFVTPAPHDRGQPTLFESGRVERAFTVPFRVGQVIWHIGDARCKPTIVSRRSDRCPPATTTTTTSTTSTTTSTSTTSTTEAPTTTTTTTTSTTTTTLPAVCGDGVLAVGEECDDGNRVESDACLNDCTFAVCSDGVVHVGVEQCDDGNVTAGDGCDALCRIETAPPPGSSCRLIVDVRQLSPVAAGKRIKLRVMWLDNCRDAFDVEVSAVLPAHTELVKVRAGVDYVVEAGAITFHVPELKAGVVGRAKIVLCLKRETSPWSSLVATTYISDVEGRTGRGQIRTVSRARKAKEFVRLYGPQRPRPNERVTYRAKYSNKTFAGGWLRMTVGPDVDVDLVDPPPTSIADGVVLWMGLPAGKHKMSVEGTFRLQDEAACGAVLKTSAVLGWSEYELRDNHATAAYMSYMLF